MDTPRRSTPRDVFAHLFATIMLTASVVSFVTLLFQYVNIAFPDDLQPWGRQAAGDTVRRAVAALVVVWPVYLYLMSLLARDVSADPEKRELKIRKWLFNFTLFAAALAIVIDLVAVVSSFLDGELTLRFVLKVLAVLLVAGAVFSYYLWDLKRATGPSRLPRLAAVGASLATVGAIAAGFFIVGTPSEQRARRFDEQRVQDLASLQWQVADYWARKQALPPSTDALTDSLSGYVAPRDPATKQPYEYRVVAALQFELCATFARPSDDGAVGRAPAPEGEGNWSHGAGRTCFTRTIDPDRYRFASPDLKPLPAPLPAD